MDQPGRHECDGYQAIQPCATPWRNTIHVEPHADHVKDLLRRPFSHNPIERLILHDLLDLVLHCLNEREKGGERHILTRAQVVHVVEDLGQLGQSFKLLEPSMSALSEERG